MSSPTTRDRDLGIDLLRGIAILGVVIFHLYTFTEGRFVFLPPRSALMSQVGHHLHSGELISAITAAFEVVFQSGGDGVSLFLILSGTALTMGALASGNMDPLAFYGRRFGRLLRAYWAGFAVVIVSLFLLAIPKTIIDGGSFQHNWSHIGIFPYFDRDQLFVGFALLPRVWKLHWFLAPPNPLWFVALILQYYLLFPFLYRAVAHTGFTRLVLGSLALSMLCTAGILLRYDGQLGSHGWIITIWSPFRIYEFTLGMALGNLLVNHREDMRRFVDGYAQTAGWALSGIVVFLLGAAIDDGDAYLRTLAFPLIATSLVMMALPVLFKVSGHLEVSIPVRTLAWIGPMSLAVLIMNEPFRFIDNYLWFKGLSWTPGWWVYIVVCYVPGTLITAAMLSRLLGLTPPTHMWEPFRALFRPADGRQRAAVELKAG